MHNRRIRRAKGVTVSACQHKSTSKLTCIVMGQILRPTGWLSREHLWNTRECSSGPRKRILPTNARSNELMFNCDCGLLPQWRQASLAVKFRCILRSSSCNRSRSQEVPDFQATELMFNCNCRLLPSRIIACRFWKKRKYEFNLRRQEST